MYLFTYISSLLDRHIVHTQMNYTCYTHQPRLYNTHKQISSHCLLTRKVLRDNGTVHRLQRRRVFGVGLPRSHDIKQYGDRPEFRWVWRYYLSLFGVDISYLVKSTSLCSTRVSCNYSVHLQGLCRRFIEKCTTLFARTRRIVLTTICLSTYLSSRVCRNTLWHRYGCPFCRLY